MDTEYLHPGAIKLHTDVLDMITERRDEITPGEAMGALVFAAVVCGSYSDNPDPAKLEADLIAFVREGIKSEFQLGNDERAH